MQHARSDSRVMYVQVKVTCFVTSLCDADFADVPRRPKLLQTVGCVVWMGLRRRP